MDSRIADDRQALQLLNEQINAAENRGDAAFLAGILAPRLAFQRADPARTVDDGVAFLQKVNDKFERRIKVIQPIRVEGDRAVVECVVTLEDNSSYHNFRLFVRREAEWKLLGWANERIS